MTTPPQLPPLPPSLKLVTHFMKVAAEHDQRDPVVAYWARFYAVQRSLIIDKSTPPAKAFIVQLLDWLEKRKKELNANEAITNETVAQAHLENYAIKLFKYADDSDRKGIFNKNVIKSFYTASLLFDVLENFGEIPEEFERMKKYGKWKAAYIHNCLKNGETPVSGPVEGEEDHEERQLNNEPENSSSMRFYLPQAPDRQTGGSSQNFQPQEQEFSTPSSGNIPHISSGQLPTTMDSFKPPAASSSTTTPVSITQLTQAQKYTKVATSALMFEDVPTAIDNLKRALHLLETGEEMP